MEDLSINVVYNNLIYQYGYGKKNNFSKIIYSSEIEKMNLKNIKIFISRFIIIRSFISAL